MDKALERALENEVNVMAIIYTIIEYGTIMLEIININKYYYNKKTKFTKRIISYP